MLMLVNSVSYLGSLGFASQLAQLLAQDLLVFNVKVLVAEEDHTTLGHYNASVNTPP